MVPPQTAKILANPLILLPVLFAIYYFIVFQPQGKADKERKKMLSSLNKNDEVVTTSGIHGTIVNVKDKTVILRIDDNVKVEMEKSSVAYVKKQQA
jgi:preprotein translocase subunit YajC